MQPRAAFFRPFAGSNFGFGFISADMVAFAVAIDARTASKFTWL
jgi:hypothetical protein